MIIFEYPFTYKGFEYVAGCHLIPPPTDMQYHVTPRDEMLKIEHGYPVIFHREKPLHITYPSTTPTDHPDGGILVQSLIDGLTAYLKTHPQYQ